MKTLEQLAKAVGGVLHGSGDAKVAGVASVGDCRDDEIAFAVEPKYISLATQKKIAGILVKEFIPDFPHPQIVIADPKMAAFQIAHMFIEPFEIIPGISQQAMVDPSARVSSEAMVMPFVFIGKGAKVGKGTVLHPGVFIGSDAVVGADCILHPNVIVGDRCIVGNNVIIFGNATIGADGFGYYQDETGAHQKIPQTGIVEVGDNVEIGANSCIDRATFGRTIIGEGTKIDNQVQIAHNCIIGKNGMIVSQAGLSGSVTLEDNVTLAAKAASVGHITIGKGAVIGAMSAPDGDVDPGAILGGAPARPHMEWKRSLVAAMKLPGALKQLARLEKRIAELEEKLDKD